MEKPTSHFLSSMTSWTGSWKKNCDSKNADFQVCIGLKVPLHFEPVFRNGWWGCSCPDGWTIVQFEWEIIFRRVRCEKKRFEFPQKESTYPWSHARCGNHANWLSVFFPFRSRFCGPSLLLVVGRPCRATRGLPWRRKRYRYPVA